ncbi:MULTISPECIES: hypothetical protein [Thiomicrorhabdus]|uniref:Uncharacterized protein n=1 Tax=Thiomicrorhabdus heinhorstiae TaxID=2748010 RepID=A0ABS0C041_9GAMM|nr:MULTISPECIES: hypothetical protein [Thiomicrorhabdus]MBF6057616.1 hypothetical protein [Thiomicrorhabdus heinhorstiae]
MNPQLKKSLRNSFWLSLLILTLGIYQQESLLTSFLSALFGFAIMVPAFWLSFRLTRSGN